MFVSGVLGRAWYALGPDEMLNLPYVANLTAVVADIVRAMP